MRYMGFRLVEGSDLGIVVRRIPMLSYINVVQKVDVPRLPTTNRASDLRESVVDT
jgi:hypothetical protein